MRNLLLAVCVAAAAMAARADYNDIKPGEDSNAQSAVEWQDANDAALAAATAEDALAAAVADEAGALALLARVRAAYESDPMALTKIAAVSQWVMGDEGCWLCFWRPSRKAGRRVWVESLLKTAETSPDAYVKTVCLDQLRWCAPACPKALARIRAVGAAGGDKALGDFAEMVARELEDREKGL